MTHILSEKQCLGIRRIIKGFCREKNVTLKDVVSLNFTHFFIPRTKCAPLQCLRALNSKYPELAPWKAHLSGAGVGYQCLSEEVTNDENVYSYLNKTLQEDIILSEKAIKSINSSGSLIQKKVCDIQYFPGDKSYTINLQYIYKQEKGSSANEEAWIVHATVFLTTLAVSLLIIGMAFTSNTIFF